MGGRVIVWGLDARSLATTIGTWRRYQKVDIVVFIAFRGIHKLYYNLWDTQLRNSYSTKE